MSFSKDDNVVETVPTDRANEPLRVSVLPWRAWRDWSVPNAHRPNTPNENFAVGAIAIADEISRRFRPAVGFGQLLCDPLGVRVGWSRPTTAARGEHAAESEGRIAVETRPSVRRTCPLLRCRLRDCEGRFSNFATAAFSSSPRGAPHNRLSRLIRRISAAGLLRLAAGLLGSGISNASTGESPHDANAQGFRAVRS